MHPNLWILTNRIYTTHTLSENWFLIDLHILSQTNDSWLLPSDHFIKLLLNQWLVFLRAVTFSNGVISILASLYRNRLFEMVLNITAVAGLFFVKVWVLWVVLTFFFCFLIILILHIIIKFILCLLSWFEILWRLFL